MTQDPGPATPRKRENLRYQLRAYEQADSCRAAAIVLALAPGAEGVDRGAVVAEWGRRYPRHAETTGRRSIRNRLSKVVGLLHIVGAVHLKAERILIGDRAVLMLIASNLAIVEADGRAVPPSEWRARPAVPSARLRAVQGALEAAAACDAAGSKAVATKARQVCGGTQ